ncbi:MAG: T9SS type A sorting domain-containing protein [Fidelibacterota bacterium]
MKYGFSIIIILMIWSSLSADITGDITLKVIRVSFIEDNVDGTTGNGHFLYLPEFDTCATYTIDPAPHDQSYFQSQLKALDNYFRSVSYNTFGLDIENSVIYPSDNEGSYLLDNTMNYYHPYGEDELHENRITELFVEAIEKAYSVDGMEFSEDDLVIIVHAGIGQDFSLPFLDPTPEDIPSTYIDKDMLSNFHGGSVTIGNSSVSHGIIIPETQNHLLYDIAEQMFADSETPCEYQFGLTGTFALMVGFAIGLPPLWDTESGQSGIGVFGLMDQGSNNGRGLIPSPPNAWTRTYAGWDEPVMVKPGSNVNLPSRSENNIVQIDINDNEYYLVENRTNWFRTGVSIDSSRYIMYEQNGRDRYPPLVEVLFDTVLSGEDIDENGVVTSIPSYDLGLPASGLLIWHIDENRINSGLSSYSVNGNRENRGIDLEEADGAQDIGYPNIFLFADPSGGYFGDMWFQGNPEYESLYPDFKGKPIEFGPFTYPNTKSNDGATTYLNISNIGLPGDTMSFSVTNAMLADGFPDASLHIGLIHDFNNDGIMEIVGGKDSLWVVAENDVTNKQYFYSTNNDVYDFSIEILENANDRLVINELLDDSTKISFFKWNTGEQTFSLVKDTVIYDNKVLFVDNTHLFSTKFLFGPSLIFFERSAYFEYADGMTTAETSSFMSVADMDLDGIGERIFIDSTGKLECRYGKRFDITATGFPIEYFPYSQTALIKNLYGDGHPEIVVQNMDNEIVIINWKGEIEYRLTDYGKLVCLSEYDGRNAIVTASAIWLFDETSESYGNEWTSTHHDFGNTRTLHLNIPKRIPDESLFNKNKTYAYPNPAYDGSVKLRIAVESAEKVEIMIYDFAGNFVKKIEMSTIVKGSINETTWNIDGIESGVYFANVKATKGSESDSKILKIGIIK